MVKENNVEEGDDELDEELNDKENEELEENSIYQIQKQKPGRQNTLSSVTLNFSY